ncbi:MAG: RHS repeat-associated core domain-containing protein, partial [Pirellulales bacterium]
HFMFAFLLSQASWHNPLFNSTMEFYYDNLNRQTGVQNIISQLGDPLVNFQSYDAAGRRTQLVVSHGEVGLLANDYDYDNLGRLKTLTQSSPPDLDPASLAVPKRVEFDYNGAGQPTAIDRYNEYDGLEVVAGTLVAGTTYVYDLAGRLKEMVNTPDVAAAVTHSWTFDAANRITSYTNSVDGTIDYDYDHTNQLTEAGNHDYVYDDAGNRQELDGVTYDVTTGNRVESDGVYDYAYDDEGNMISKTEIAGTKSWTYQWDHRNRLTSVAFDGPYANSDFTVAFEYDVFNRRTSRLPEYDVSPGYVYDNSPQFYIYDGDNVVIDFGDVDGPSTTPSLGLARKYLFGPAVDQVLAVEDMTQQIYTADRVLWLLGDHQNTTRDIVDNAGQLEVHNQYDAFGRLTAGSEGHTRYLYTGREWDYAIGLQYNRNRWYNPDIGRWLSEDPIGFLAGDANLYRYVSNSPTNFTDPSGYAKLVLNPEKADSMDWHRWTAPAAGGTVGDTNVKFSITWQPFGIDVGCGQIYKVVYTITASAEIILDPTKIARLANTPRGISLEQAYGHEQRHVENFINFVNAAKEELEGFFEPETYGSLAAAHSAARKHATDVQNALSAKVAVDKLHRTPGGPLRGEPYDPIGTMPRDPK